MSNLVQTFKSFNKGCRRPDHTRHLQLCGFELTKIVNPDVVKPSVYAKQLGVELTERTGKNYHFVSRPIKDSDGWTFYEIWVKENER